MSGNYEQYLGNWANPLSDRPGLNFFARSYYYNPVLKAATGKNRKPAASPQTKLGKYVKFLNNIYSPYAMLTPDQRIRMSLFNLLMTDKRQDQFNVRDVSPPKPLLAATKRYMELAVPRAFLAAIVAVPIILLVELAKIVTGLFSPNRGKIIRDSLFTIFRRVICAPIDIMLALPIGANDVYTAKQFPVLYKGPITDKKKLADGLTTSHPTLGGS